MPAAPSPIPADTTAEAADRAFLAMADALAAAFVDGVDARADQLREYLEHDDPDVSRVTRLLQLVETATGHVADVYRRWHPECSAFALESPDGATAASLFATRLVEAELNAGDPVDVPAALGAVVEGQDAAFVLEAVLELAATYGVAAVAVASAVE